MRFPQEQADYIKNNIQRYLPKSDVYLFGSRVDDQKKGGDIDILIIADEKLKLDQKIAVKISFYKKFGEQKIDIVSFTKDEDSNFKKLILLSAQKL